MTADVFADKIAAARRILADCRPGAGGARAQESPSDMIQRLTAALEEVCAGAEEFRRQQTEHEATRQRAEIERLQAKEALRVSRAQLAGIIESAMDAVITVDADQRILLFNTAAERVFRCPASEVLGQPIDRFIPETVRARHREHVRAFGQSNVTSRRAHALGSLIALRADGEEFPMEAAISQAEVAGQKLYTVILRDITQRKLAEQALRESEERVRLLLDSTGEAIYGIDLSGTCTFCNAACLRILGYRDPRDLLGRNMHSLIHHTRPDGTPYPVVDCRIYQAYQRGVPTHADDEMLWRADGTSFPAEYWSHPVHRGDDLIGCVVTFLDITQRQQAEAALRTSREQLRALAGHLQSVREEERTRIAREIHDELGQVLTGLRFDLTRLATRLTAGQAAVRDNVQGMLTLVDSSIQAVRRIATDLRPSVLDDLGLVAALEWQAQEFQGRTGTTCQFIADQRDLAPDPDVGTAVFRICQETLTNVARHADASQVTVRLQEQEGALVLTVADNGQGITDQGLASRTSLGLLGMRERARLLGGRVSIEGRPGEGTTVSVFIPLMASGSQETMGTGRTPEPISGAGR
ncbi:MAG TPA: PAS domain S-box protein [Candidatus Methylomirabilis sp.]|nr:PAS domain S-box protein [Candidatus Methylomirabilis sp.]